MVINGSLIRAAASFSILTVESRDIDLRTFNADRIRLAQSLFLERYSSLYCERFVKAGNSVNSDLII